MIKIRICESEEPMVPYVLKFLMYILIEKHTTFQLKTIPLINAYLLLFNNNRRLKNDKYERKTRGYYSAFSGW